MSKRFISLDVVLDRVCLSKSQIYRKIHAGEFPQPVPLGPQKVAFLERDVDGWMAERLEAREMNEGNAWRRARAKKARRARK